MINEFNDIDDNAKRWLYILIYILYDDVMRCHENTVMLRCTTGSYGRPVIEVAYRETLFHFTEVVWEMKTREEWLGCRHDASPMLDILGSTPVWASYIIFWFL